MFKGLFGIHSIQNKLLLNVVIFTFIPFMLVAVFAYFAMRQFIFEQNDRSVNAELAKAAGSINIQLDFYLQRSASIVTNSYLLATINAPDVQQDMERFYEFQRMVEANLLGYDDNQYTIYLRGYHGFQGKFISDIANLEKLPVYREIKKSGSTEVVWSPETKTMKSERYVTFYRNITSATRYEAILEVNIPYRLLYYYLSNMSLPSAASVIHLNADGKVIGSVVPDEASEKTDSASFAALMANTKSNFINKNNHLYDGSQIVVVVPKSIIAQKYGVVLLVMAIVFVVVLFAIFVASRFTIQRMTRSLNEFISYIRTNNNLFLNDEPIDQQGDDEVGFIKRKFAGIINQAREMFGDLEKERSERNKLEIELLQSRLNPHLLYNSLSVIKWSAMKQGDERTVEIVNAMSSYYRIALNRGSSIILVSKELNMIEQYVKIVSYTHENTYGLDIRIDPEMLKFQVLKHLLQPVVENAIMHGLNGRSKGGVIRIEGWIEQNDLVFSVSDNGFGMTEETMEAIRSERYESDYGGYGLRNLMHRLRHYYGEGYGIELESVLQEGTTVIIRTKKSL